MNRREFVRYAGVGMGAGVAGVSGCLNDEPDDDNDETQLDEDPLNPPEVYGTRPDAVYHPTHTEGMDMVGMQTAGDYTVGLMYSYPHRFWTLTGTDTSRVDIDADEDDVHLMVSVWDRETGEMVPTSVTSRVRRGGEVVSERNLWKMMMQEMGFHHADNIGLDGDGEYEIELEVVPESFERRRGYEGRFEDAETVTFDFDYEEARRDLIFYEVFTEGVGERRALEPMDHGMGGSDHDHGDGHPIFFAPHTEGETVGDLVLAPRATELNGEPYLAVYAATPHNGYTVPDTVLSATVGGEEVSLRESLDNELGFHYGEFVDEIPDTVEVSVGTPPQVTRHEGYETAFLETGSVEADVVEL